MAPAVYNLATVDRMRAAAKIGHGVHWLASTLEWPAESVRKIAYRHCIALCEDSPVRTVAKIRAAVSAAPKKERAAKPAKMIAPRNEYIRRTKSLKEHPRSEYLTVSISRAALKEIRACARRFNLQAGAVPGIVIDHLARAAKLDGYVDAARAELKAQGIA